MFYLKRVHAGLMLLAKDYLSLQDRLEHCQSVLDVEVKENQRREAVTWRQETALGRLKAKIASFHPQQEIAKALPSSAAKSLAAPVRRVC